MEDTVTGLLQELEMGDVIFNTDTSNIYKTSKTINNDKFKNKPDIETYTFSNDTDVKLYQKVNGIVLPIRIHNKLYLNNVKTNGVYIVRYYHIYRDMYHTINDILRYYNIHSDDLSNTIKEQIRDILTEGNKPLSNKISVRMITFIPLELIQINGNYSIQDTVISTDIQNFNVKKNMLTRFINNKINKNKTSLTIDIEYESNDPKQMYYKLNDELIKIKTLPNEHSDENILTITSTAGKYVNTISFGEITDDNRSLHNLFIRSEKDNPQETQDARVNEHMEHIYDLEKKKYGLIENIKSYLINNEQERLNIKMAVMKLTEQVNKNNNVDKENLNSLTNIVKLFKAIL